MKTRGLSLSRELNFAMTVFSLWFFGELAFNVLPIAVILVINLSFQESFEKILLLPDWSFASVVICGSILSAFIELKTRYQKDSSYKVYAGTRLFTLLLIAAVISLTLAVLREKGINIDTKFLGELQIALFGLSAFSLLAPILLKVHFLDTHRMTSNSVQSKSLVKYLLFSLDEANDNLRHSILASKKHHQVINELCNNSMAGSDFQKDRKDIEKLIDQLEESLHDFKEEWCYATETHNSPPMEKPK